MRSLQKSFVVVALLFAGALFWFQYAQYQTTELSRAFYRELARSNETFDLRKINAVDWDELVFWSPYQDICSYGINGFEKESPACESSSDDGECYLLFLRQNKLVGKISINRKKIDLTKAKLNGRIPRPKAVFKFVTKSDWPEVQLVK